MTEFVSKITRLAKNVAVYGAVVGATLGAYAPQYSYEHEASIRRLPSHYLDVNVVAFTKPEDAEIVVPDSSLLPYENGIHSEKAVIRHEWYHNLIHKAGGIHDERAINNRVAYDLGYSHFPFHSY